MKMIDVIKFFIYLAGVSSVFGYLIYCAIAGIY